MTLATYFSFPTRSHRSALLDLLYRIKTEMLGSGNETVASLLPETLEDVTEMEEEKFEKAILTKRSLEWIKKNGEWLSVT